MHKEKSSIDFTDHSCLECGQLCCNRRSVGNHINRSHDMSIEEYVLKHYFGGIVPKCECGCGADVRWHKSQYYYCNYLSGHNGSGFSSTNQPTWTDEMIERRSNAIRQSYAKSGADIKQKISTALKETFATPDSKERLSSAQKRIWADDEYRDRMKGVRKRVWAEQHDELCEKIFTPEFGLKISASNMRRDLKHGSAEQERFIDRLVSVLGPSSVHRDGMWLNDPTDGSAHFDVVITVGGERMLVEWDGTFYHGLDRDSGFTLTQLIHIANDFRKNRMAARAGMALVRVPGSVEPSSILSFSDIIVQCRHYQRADGAVMRDGMFCFSSDDQALVTREQLVRNNETATFPSGKGKEHTKASILPAIKELLCEYVRARGWLYPMRQHTLVEALASIRTHPVSSSGVISSLTSAGSDFLKERFRSFWDVSGGPVEAFADDKRLDAVLRYRLGLNSSKPYTYTLSDGVEVTCSETFDITPKAIRRGFIVQRRAVSWFKPTAAYELYRRFLGDAQSPIVWDPSCGFGARLLGFAAAYPHGRYIGTDPATRTFSDLTALREELLQLQPDMSVELHCKGSELLQPEAGSLDLVFTSPPYFDKERYFDEPTQCWKRFSDIDGWVRGYLRPTMVNVSKGLRSDGAMVLNVSPGLRGLTVAVADGAGFRLDGELQLNVGRHAFARKAGHAEAETEPILIFRKR